MTELLNGTGLVLDIAGILFLYIYGLPSKVQEPREGLEILFAGISDEEKKSQERVFSYYRRMSRYG